MNKCVLYKNAVPAPVWIGDVFTFLLNFLILDSCLLTSRFSRSSSNASSVPQTSSALFSTCKCRYSFISPHLMLCGFLRTMNFKGGSRLSMSQSFKRYSSFASVLVISECLSLLSLKQYDTTVNSVDNPMQCITFNNEVRQRASWHPVIDLQTISPLSQAVTELHA